MKRLPDTEFEIMKVVWASKPPISTNIIMEQLGKEKDWKASTIITLMLRLVDRGYLRTEKNGKERTYFPLISKEDYLQFETGNFVKQYHENSFVSLFNALYDGQKMSDKEIDELIEWAKGRKK